MATADMVCSMIFFVFSQISAAEFMRDASSEMCIKIPLYYTIKSPVSQAFLIYKCKDKSTKEGMPVEKEWGNCP